MENISFDQIRIFIDVSQYGGFREVARRRGCVPSRISKSLRRLESQLGRELVRRSKTGVLLTREGLDFLPVAKAMLGELEEYSQRASHVRRRVPRKVPVTIGTLSFLGRHLIVPLLDIWPKIIPDSRLRILDLPPDEIVSAGLGGALDMALYIGPMSWTENWHVSSVGTLHWGLYCRADHPLFMANGQTLSEKNLREVTFVVPTYWTGKGYAIGNDLCPLSWSERTKGHEASTAEAGLHIARHSNDLIFAPSYPAKALLQAGALRELRIREWSPVERTVFFAANGDRVKASWVKQLTRCVATVGECAKNSSKISARCR